MTPARTARNPCDVWAPHASRLRLALAGEVVEMRRADAGWWTPDGPTPDPARGDVDYGYLIDDSDDVRPDPRSRRQPDGVHALSRTYDASGFAWTDDGWSKPLKPKPTLSPTLSPSTSPTLSPSLSPSTSPTVSP